MGEICGLFLTFTIYSFIGWACETVYCSMLSKKIINRGFLNGPFCPVYGFGALLLLLALDGLPRNVFLVFLFGTAVTTALEYFTGWLLEKLFHAKWWDYSANHFNYRGRICLLNSILFGFLSALLIFVLNPLTQTLISYLNDNLKIILSAFVFMYFSADLAVTIGSMHKLNLRLEALSSAMASVKEKLDTSNFYIALNVKERLEKLYDVLDTERGRSINASVEKFRERIKMLELDNHALQKRIIRAFPNIRSTRYPDILNNIKEKVLAKKGEKN